MTCFGVVVFLIGMARHMSFIILVGLVIANWWDNVSEKASVVTCTGDKGTTRKFKLNYKTLDVLEVQ